MYRKTAKGWMKHLDFIALDALSLLLAFVISYIYRIGFKNPFKTTLYINIVIVSLLTSFVVALCCQTFKGVLKRGYYVEALKTVKQVVYVILFTAFYLFLTQAGKEYSRLLLIYTSILYLIYSYSFRVLHKCILSYRKSNREIQRGLLILTTYNMVESTLDKVQNNNYEGFYIVGLVILDRDCKGEVIQEMPIVANKSDVINYVCHQWVDEVLISAQMGELNCDDLIENFITMGISVHQKIRSNYGDEKEHINEHVENLGGYTVLTTSIKIASTRALVFKRLMDIFGGLVGCIITAVIFVFLGPVIYIKSPGPIFFQQERVGKNGRKFKIYKFRSMYMDAEERKKEMMDQNEMSDGMMFKVKWDKRIIGSEKGPDKGIGNFIRKYSLDEWPQFYNILMGDMSLVGTRPPTLDEWEQYELHHRARLATKPGLTGLWQVSGRSNITEFEEVVALDMEYIKKWNIGLDIKILLKTVLVVLKQDGAM